VSEKKFKPLDQLLHASLGFLLTVIPLAGALFGVVAREYYQRKRTMEGVLGREPTFGEVMDADPPSGDEGFKFFKRDLVFSYIGIGIGAAGLLIVWLI